MLGGGHREGSGQWIVTNWFRGMVIPACAAKWRKEWRERNPEDGAGSPGPTGKSWGIPTGRDLGPQP